MKTKILGSEELVKTEDLIVTASIAGHYVDGGESGSTAEESGSAAVESYLVALHMLMRNGDEMPAAPYTFADIKAAVEAAGGEMKVAGIELEEPKVIRSAKTRAYMYQGAANAVCSMRYEF